MKISIIVPVYNKQRYIRTILSQIMNQSFKDYECIVIDDGSTDKSGAICDEFSHKDKKFKVIHIPNSGVSHARNLGLDKAVGEYITFIDADDQIAYDYLEHLYKDLRFSDADILITGYQKTWELSSRVEYISPPYLEGIYSWKEILPSFSQNQINTGIFGFCWGKLLKREKIGDIRFNEELKLAEDFEFYLRIYPNVNRVYFNHKCEYLYTQQALNSSSIVEDNQIDYLSQVFINIQYKNFLIKMESYTEDNKKNVDMIIGNYIFFTVFHSTLNAMQEKCVQLSAWIEKEDLYNSGSGYLAKFIFFLLKKKRFLWIKLIFIIRRSIKKIVRGEY